MKVGVVGTGSMGKNHARVYASLTEYCQLAGVYDADYDRACAVAQQMGTVAYRTLPDLLREVDAVSVAVPTSVHVSTGLECLNQSVHVLMEKPIADTVPQAKKLIENAKDNEVILQVGHIELFNPAVAVLKDLVQKEEIINVEMKRLRPLEKRMAQSDVVNDLMIHDISILFELLGNQVRHYYAMGWQMDGSAKQAAALLRMQSGSLAALTASYLDNEQVRTVRVVTRQSVFVADLLRRTVRKSNFSGNGQWYEVPVPEREPLREQLIHFLKCIKEKKQPKVTGEDGLAALALANKIRRKIPASC